MRTLTRRLATFLIPLSLALAASSPSSAQAPPSPAGSGFPQTADSAAPGTPSIDRIVDAFISRENDLLRNLLTRHPLVETYIQTFAPDAELGSVPKEDHYFLGELDISDGVSSRSLVPSPGLGAKVSTFFSEIWKFTFLPNGFAQMILLDTNGFDREHYDFEFVRREFLGEVRTLVFEMTPRERSGVGRFLGRIWVEDKDYSIVRFNGTYVPSTMMTKYLHFDSWRVQMGPGLWLPAYVYSEESDYKYFVHRKLKFKGQTRIWGYDVRGGSNLDEFTKVMVEAPSAHDTTETASDLSPVASTRAWERQAEENVVERLTVGGLLAPAGEVDKILSTVVNNLEVTNNLDVQPEVRCRVLLTTPLESFSVGHTIVLSRGLIDVLPDEASLAMILAHELGHIVLGHRLDTRYAFNDRVLFGDEQTFKHFGLQRDPREEAEADLKAVQLLTNSPYKDKLANGGLFLKALAARQKALASLIRPHMGSEFARGKKYIRMGALMDAAPDLEMTRTDQIAALPLGGRVKVDPWNGRIELLKNKPTALLSAREKMPFEVTPFMPYLTRIESGRRLAGENAADGRPASAAREPQAPPVSPPPSEPPRNPSDPPEPHGGN